MSLYSDKAVEAAQEATRHVIDEPLVRAFDAAHDPALGRDASINVKVVLYAYDLWRLARSAGRTGLAFPDWFEREHREGRLT